MSVRQATVWGTITTFHEGAVGFSANDLVDFLAQGDPRQNRDTPGHDILTLDQATGLRLRWLGSAPTRTAMVGEPPVDYVAAVDYVGHHERLMTHAAGLGVLGIPRHTTFVVEGDPYYKFPVTYSVVEYVRGQPLVHSDSKRDIRAADPAKLIALGHAWLDILTDPDHPEGPTWHEDAVSPRQVNEWLVHFDGDPRLSHTKSFPLNGIDRWVRRMHDSHEQAALRDRIKAAQKR